jgi:rod shape-determining protein MreC
VISYQPFQKKQSYRLAAAIALLTLALSVSAYNNLFGLRSLLVSAVYPFQWLAWSTGKIVIDVPSTIINLGNLSRENSQLKGELAAAHSKLNLFDELADENRRLRTALDFRQTNAYGFNLLSAHVVARGVSAWRSLVEVDRGSLAGVRVGMVAIDRKGLVGKVVETAPAVSKVLLIIDPASAVAACDQRSRDCGLVQGGDGNKLKMDYVETDGDIRVGDRIVTASISEVFPPGIPVGTVVAASKKDAAFFYQIEIEPSVVFSRLEELYLVK